MTRTGSSPLAATGAISDNEQRPLPPAYLAWLIWAIGALFYLSGYYLRVSPAVMTVELMRSFNIGAKDLGTLSGIFFYVYVAMQVPTGIMVDTLGPRKLLIWGGFVGAVSTVLLGTTHIFALACLARALAGGATALEWLVLLKLGAHWFPHRKFSMLAGLGLFFGNIGALTAQVPLRLLVVQFGWRTVLVASGIFLLIFCFLSWAFVRDDPSELGMRSYATPEQQQQKHAHFSELLKGFLRIFTYRNTWLVCLSTGGFVGPMIGFTGLWAVPFLTVRFGLKTTMAAGVSSIMIISWAIACPICGDFSDRIQKRKPIMVTGALLSSIGWIVLFYAPHLPLWGFVVIGAVTSFCCGVTIIAFAYCRESVPPQCFGVSNATVNIGNMLGPAMIQPLMGWILDKYWLGQMSGGVRVYNLAAMQWAVLPIVAWSCLSLLLLLLSRETYGKQTA